MKKWGVLLIAVIIILGGLLAWSTKRKVSTVTPLPYEDTDPTFVPVAWPMFFNAELGFIVQYPPTYRASGNASIPLQIVEIPSEENPTPIPVLTTISREGDSEDALEYMRATYVVEEIERLPYTRYVKVVAHEKERPAVHTEYFIRSSGKVFYILLGWDGVDWRYTANVASSLEFEE